MFNQSPVFVSAQKGWTGLSGLSAALLWAAAAASAVAWGLEFWPGDGKPLAPSVSQLANTAPAGPQATDIGKVLGANQAVTAPAPAAPDLASRLALIGIAKSGDHQSVALIAVDGQAAKPFARGAEVLPGLVLQNVNMQQALLGAGIHGPAQLQLSMPLRPAPATGVMPNKP